MQLSIFLGILLAVRTSILIECSPLLGSLPIASELYDLSSEDDMDDMDSDDFADDDLMTPQLVVRSPLSSYSSMREVRSNELVLQDEADLEDVLRELVRELSRHSGMDTRTRELVEMYDVDIDDDDGYTTNSRSLRRYSSRSYGPDPFLDVDEEDIKVVSRTTYHLRALEKTLRRMALDSTKVQIAYNIIREKQVNFHPSSSVYKILEKSVSILHKTRRPFGRSSYGGERVPYPSRRRGDRRNGGRRGRKHFRNKLSKMGRRLKNKFARMGRNLIRKPVELMYKYM